MKAFFPRVVRWAGALVVTIGLVALLVLAGFNVGWSDHEMRKQLDDRAQETATVWSSYIQFRMDMLARYLETRSADPQLVTHVKAGTSQRAALTAQLTAIQTSYATISSVAVLDRSGRLLATAATSTVGGRADSHREAYLGAVKAGTTYRSSAYRSVLPGHPFLIDLVTPIRERARNAPLGYLVASPALVHADVVTAVVPARSGLTMTVVDRNGATVVASDDRPLGVVDPTTPQWLGKVRTGASGTTTIRAGDAQAVVGYRSLPDGWFAAVQLPASTVLTPLSHLKTVTVLLTAGLALLIIVAGALLLHGNRVQKRSIDRLEVTRAELADALAQLRLRSAERQRLAREVNDTIVQGLVAAELSYDLDEGMHTRDILRATSRQARAWVGELLVEGGRLEPGTARRQEPAHHLIETAPR